MLIIQRRWSDVGCTSDNYLNPTEWTKNRTFIRQKNLTLIGKHLEIWVSHELMIVLFSELSDMVVGLRRRPTEFRYHGAREKAINICKCSECTLFSMFTSLILLLTGFTICYLILVYGLIS